MAPPALLFLNGAMATPEMARASSDFFLSNAIAVAGSCCDILAGLVLLPPASPGLAMGTPGGQTFLSVCSPTKQGVSEVKVVKAISTSESAASWRARLAT